jgi:hypothetical protein
MGKLFDLVNAAYKKTMEIERQERLEFEAKEKARRARNLVEKSDVLHDWMENEILPLLTDQKIVAAFEGGAKEYRIDLWSCSNETPRNYRMLRILEEYPFPDDIDVEFARNSKYDKHERWHTRMDFPLGRRMKEILDDGLNIALLKESHCKTPDTYDNIGNYETVGEYICIWVPTR